MSDAEKWANLEGPEPKEVRELFAPLRAALPSRAKAEDMTRAVLEKLAVQEDGATPEAALPLRFEAWAELAASLVGAGPEERLEALDARDLGFEDWMRCEAHYSWSLADDLAAGRRTRIELYARLCGEAVARRDVLPEAAAPEAAAALPAPGAPAVAAAPKEAATFQKIEQSPAPAPAPAERKSNPLAMTAGPVPLSSPVVPFVAAPPPPPPPPPGTAKTTKLPAADPMKGATFPLGTDHSVLFDRPALPFAEQTMTGSASAPFPRWKVNEYATFRAEVEDARPDQVEQILAKFRVPGPASRQAMDEYWRQVFAADPAMDAVFKQLFPTYLAYVRSQRR